MNNKTIIGMTIVESIVAISVLLMVSTVTMSLISDAMKTKRVSQDYAIATFLASEGIELVRQIRDTNLLEIESDKQDNDINNDNDVSWLRYMDSDSSDCVDNSCTIDANKSVDSRMAKCDGDCVPMSYHSSNGYQYDSGAETKFIRTIYLDNSSNSLEVTSRVSWQDQSNKERKVEIIESLYKWD